MTTRVFYESWQLQCCGDPFKVGDTIKWQVVPTGPGLKKELGPALGAGVEWFEDHHQSPDESPSSLEGTVTSIRAVRQRFRRQLPGKNFLVAVRGDAVATELESADGWESEENNPPSYSFTGYIVTVE
jgi:hypothetical protein